MANKSYYYNGAAILAPLTITSNQPYYDSTTISLKTQRVTQSAQRWEISFSTILEVGNQVDSFLDSFVDLESASTMVMPQLTEVFNRATHNGTPVVSLNASTGDDSVVVDSSVTTGLIPKGSFIKFSNHDKVYVVRSDVDMDDGSTASVDIYPSLKNNVASATTSMLLGDDVVFSYYRSIDNQTGITFTDGVLSNAGSINLFEAI